MAKDYYNRQKYITEKGIDTYHKVEQELIDTKELFEKHLEYLDGPAYTSIAAEKSRMAYYKGNVKLVGVKETKLKKFESLIRSFLHSVSPEMTLEKVEKDMYQLAHNNMHRAIYIPGERFSFTWMHNDVIYRDEFKIVNLDKPTSKILIIKSMKAPFALDRTSLSGNAIRMEFRRGWKVFIEEIRKGINNI